MPYFYKQSKILFSINDLRAWVLKLFTYPGIPSKPNPKEIGWGLTSGTVVTGKNSKGFHVFGLTTVWVRHPNAPVT